MDVEQKSPAGAPRKKRTRRCVVHIGLNKTGSTTIQGWLAANRAELAAQGIRYDPFDEGRHPSMGHAIGFVALAVHRTGRLLPSEDGRAHLNMHTLDAQARLVADFEARAEAALSAAGHRSYVISSEFLPAWLPKPDQAKVFHDWLARYFERIRYVVYLRDQVDWVASAYAQYVKTGGTETLDEYVVRRGERNYLRTCMNWLKGVGRGRLDVRLLDREALEGGDLIADFANVIRADTADTRAPEILNEAMDAAALDEVLQINRKAKNSNGLWTREKRGRALTRLLENSTGDKLRLSPEQALDVARRNARSNEKLRRRFFSDREILFPKSHAILTSAEATTPHG